MSKKPDIWMPWFIADYLADTTHLSNAEHGSYMLMLAHAWMHEGILPTDDDRLARLARMNHEEWIYSRDTLMAFFTKNGDGYFQKRLKEELTKANNMQRQHGIAGKASAAARWGNGKATKK